MKLFFTSIYSFHIYFCVQIKNFESIDLGKGWFALVGG